MLLSIADSTVSTAAPDGPTGLWRISYQPQWGSAGDMLTCGSVMTVSKGGPNLMGEASLGNRKDGSLIGTSRGNAFDAAITFRQKPSIFIRLKGEYEEDMLQGSFSTTASDGSFYRGHFVGRRPSAENSLADTAASENALDSATPMAKDIMLQPQPTRFIDPEAVFYNQTGKAKMEMFIIACERNTILMCRNVPMIWQWWL